MSTTTAATRQDDVAVDAETPGAETPGAETMEPEAALKALAHPARWTMMELIHRGGGEICVCEFQEHLDLTQPTISHHLKTLREAGLIESRQEGTWVYHTIRRGAVRALTGLLDSWARPAPDDEGGNPAGAGAA